MEENLLDVLWSAHFVDRRVKTAVQSVFSSGHWSPDKYQWVEFLAVGRRRWEVEGIGGGTTEYLARSPQK
jgi:hypothetical protein